MIVWVVIGLVVGTLLGLTGAGGAVIAVPIFVYVIGVDVRVATVLSLMAVLIGALISWPLHARKTDIHQSLMLWTFSFLGSAGAYHLKKISPQWVITASFISVCLLSVSVLWLSRFSFLRVHQKHDSGRSLKRFVQSGAGGIALGALVTMTGLGGGVLLMPLLVGFIGLPMDRAVATSMLTIALTTSVSFWIQREAALEFITFGTVLALAAGSIVGAKGVQRFAMQFSPNRMDLIRTWVITGVILLSITSLLIK